MNLRRGFAVSLLLACGVPPLLAQPAVALPPPPRLDTLPVAPPAAPARSASAAAPAAAAASAAHVRVIEDDSVRIEETRDARGQLQRVTVKSKLGGKSYEIVVPPGGKDASQPRGTSGQAAWRLFEF